MQTDECGRQVQNLDKVVYFVFSTCKSLYVWNIGEITE